MAVDPDDAIGLMKAADVCFLLLKSQLSIRYAAFFGSQMKKK